MKTLCLCLLFVLGSAILVPFLVTEVGRDEDLDQVPGLGPVLLMNVMAWFIPILFLFLFLGSTFD